MINRTYEEGVFKSKWLSKFINCWFFTGEKIKIEKLIYYSFFIIKKRFNISSLFFFFESLERLKPWVGLKLHRGYSKKKKIQVCPLILNSKVQFKKAMYWLIKSTQLRKESCLSIKISNEICNLIFNEITNSIKKKKEHYNYAVMFKSVKTFKW
uniref:Ribosomal protein S7 n=1 Tax=Rhizaria sp. TaxID=2204297 RepID=A0A5P8DJY1_9EUKA|nr:ribosomal protein S7 [Rhizaria sp.]